MTHARTRAQLEGPLDGLGPVDHEPADPADPAVPLLVRQGDVLLVQVEEIPEGARPVGRERGRVVLAWGEVTGHAHAIRSRSATLHRAGTQRFLRVVAPVTLDHEEHAPIELAPGSYRVVIQREYVPAEISAASFRPVRD